MRFHIRGKRFIERVSRVVTMALVHRRKDTGTMLLRMSCIILIVLDSIVLANITDSFRNSFVSVRREGINGT